MYDCVYLLKNYVLDNQCYRDVFVCDVPFLIKLL